MLGQKGGGGKTTLAVHLAVAAQQAGERVVVLDCDPQASAFGWFANRLLQGDDGEGLLVVQCAPSEIRETVAAIKNTSLVLIDTAPHANIGASQSLELADFALLPCRPTALDLGAVGAAVKLLRASGARGGIVLNACPLRAPEIAEARVGLTIYEKHAPVIGIEIAERRSLFRALSHGRSVTEFEPNGVAAKEIHALWKFTKEQLVHA